MKRQQVIRVYLMASLKKRLWVVILPAIALGTVAFLLTFSLRISLPVVLLTAVFFTAGILWSSYRRHLDLGDFPTGHELQVDPPFIVED